MTEQTAPTASPPETTALAKSDTITEIQKAGGVHALGEMDDQQFEGALETLTRGMARLDRIIKEVLKEGLDADFATIPGTKKKDLLLPGAEKLCFLARLVPEFALRPTNGDGIVHPHIHYSCGCTLHRGDGSGPVVSQGIGTANSFEDKFRYRSAERTCPSCGKPGTLRKSKFEARGGPFKGLKVWYCWDKVGGCKAEFAPDDPKVVEQPLGRVPHPNPYDLDNTLAKMSKTRAFKDAVKTAMAGSARFTQDVAENERETEGEAVEGEATYVHPEVVRADLVTELSTLARDRGFKKLGEIFSAMVEAGLLSPTVTEMRDVPTKSIEHMCNIWRTQANQARAAEGSVDEDAAEQDPVA